jgi:hypothetical protein
MFNSARCAIQKAPPKSYKIQMIHPLKPSDQVAHINYAVDMLERIDASPAFLRQVCFSDEATFHVNGVVNSYNCRIWGSQTPCVTCELESVIQLNARHVDWTVLLFGKDCDQTFVLGHAGAVCAAPITT